MSSPTWQLPLIFLLILTNLSAFVTSQYTYVCSENGNYTIDSTYDANLKILLSSLPSNIGKYNGMFYTASQGQSPDQTNAMALCRGDIQLDDCRSCVQNATDQLLKLCPNQKEAIIWAEICMLRYSNKVIYETMATDPGLVLINTYIVTNPEPFRKILRNLLDNLRGEAAIGKLPAVAAGSRTVPSSFEAIYAMVQCTPDLSKEDCRTCLMTSSETLEQFSAAASGARILFPSCTIRYEMYPFFNSTALPAEPLAPPPGPGPPPKGKDDDSRIAGKEDDSKIIIIIVLLIVLCLIVIITGGIFIRNKVKLRQMEKLQLVDGINMINMAESIRYDFGTIRVATNNFSDASKLGQGGFGVVYMGILSNGQKIAVKRLSKDSKQGDLEFENEVLLLAKLQHRNLVRLLGFSMEGGERLLIYEFVQNASLDRFIFGSTQRSYFDWDTRYKVIRGIARGILYLHEDSCVRIIHRDLKASNILLDEQMNPKICDFGMAWLFVPDETQSNTNRIVGTYGYMAPEYLMYGQFSIKSDVFSFGVLILEIISGQKNHTLLGENVEGLLSFAWRNWCDGTTVNIIDTMMKARSDSLREIVGCIHIALLCVQENASDRPTMAAVISMLNTLSITLPLPSHPPFSAHGHTEPNASILKGNNSKELMITRSSTCDASISELYPR